MQDSQSLQCSVTATVASQSRLPTKHQWEITEHCVNGIFSATVGGIEAAANVTACQCFTSLCNDRNITFAGIVASGGGEIGSSTTQRGRQAAMSSAKSHESHLSFIVVSFLAFTILRL